MAAPPPSAATTTAPTASAPAATPGASLPPSIVELLSDNPKQIDIQSLQSARQARQARLAVLRNRSANGRLTDDGVDEDLSLDGDADDRDMEEEGQKNLNVTARGGGGGGGVGLPPPKLLITPPVYSPSIPGTPSNISVGARSSSSTDSPPNEPIEEEETHQPKPNVDIILPSSTPAAPHPPSGARKSIDIAEIPPFRGGTPKPTSPSPPPIVDPPVVDAEPDVVKVVMPPGLMQRMAQMKDKKKAAGTGTGTGTGIGMGAALAGIVVQEGMGGNGKAQDAGGQTMGEGPPGAPRESIPTGSRTVPSNIDPKYSPTPPQIETENPPISTVSPPPPPPPAQATTTERDYPTTNFDPRSRWAEAKAELAKRNKVEELLAAIERQEVENREEENMMRGPYEHIELSPIEERSERATTASSRSSHISNYPQSPLFSNPVGVFSQHPGRQLADGSIKSFNSPTKSTAPLFSSDPRYSPRIPLSDSPAPIRQSPPTTTSFPPRNPSPTRRMSPEVQKRAAAFETSQPAQPTSDPTPSSSADHSGDSSAGSKNFALFKKASFASLKDQVAKPRLGAETGVPATKAPSTIAFSELQPSMTGTVERGSSQGGSPHVNSLPVYEGYILLPPANADSARERLARWTDWERHYAVLTHDKLELRPTDRDHLDFPVVVFRIENCVKVDVEMRQTLDFRPFAVALDDGEVQLLATEAGKERSRWVSAISEAILIYKTTRIPEPEPDEPPGPLPEFHKSIPRQPSKPQSIEDLLAVQDGGLDDRRSIISRTTLSTDVDSLQGRPFPFRTDSTFTDIQTRDDQPASPTKVKLRNERDGSPVSEKTELSSVFGGGRVPPAYEEKKFPKDLYEYRASSGRGSPSFVSSYRGPLPQLPEKDKDRKSKSKSTTTSPAPIPDVDNAHSSSTDSPHSSPGSRHRPPQQQQTRFSQPSPAKSPHQSPRSGRSAALSGGSPSLRDARQLIRSERSGRSGRSLVPMELRPEVESLIRRVAVRDRELYASLERQERHFAGITAEVLEIKRKLMRFPEFNEVDEEQVPLSYKVDFLLELTTQLLRDARNAPPPLATAPTGVIQLPPQQEATLSRIEYLLEDFAFGRPQGVDRNPWSEVRSQTTRGGDFTAAQEEAWRRDVERMAIEAQHMATRSPVYPPLPPSPSVTPRPRASPSAPQSPDRSETTSKYVERERASTARRLEGLDGRLPKHSPPFGSGSPPLTRHHPGTNYPLHSSPLKHSPGPELYRPIPLRPHTNSNSSLNRQGPPLVDRRMDTDPFARNAVPLEPFRSRFSEDTQESGDPYRTSQTHSGPPSPTRAYHQSPGRRQAASEDLGSPSRGFSREFPQTASPRFSTTSQHADDVINRMHETLSQIQEHFTRQAEVSEQTLNHQKKVSQFILDLSNFMTQERDSRENKHQEQSDRLQSVIAQIANLPNDLLVQLEMASGMPPEPGEPIAEYEVKPQQDIEQVPSIGPDPESPGDANEEPIPAHLLPDTSRTLPAGPGLAKAYESLANLERKMSGASTVKGDTGKRLGSLSKKLKGPRGPVTIAGQRIWGGPEPVGDRRVRWGIGAGDQLREASKKTEQAAVANALDPPKPPGAAIADLIKENPHIGEVFEGLSKGDAADPGVMALAVFEILQTIREIRTKQEEKEKEDKKRAEEEAKKGLSKREQATLQAKREEVARLEALKQASTAQMQQLAGLISSTGQKTEDLLKVISKEVTGPKVKEVDPALTEATKKLLGQLKSGVDEHVKDFRGQITGEVQRTWKELERLREEKKELQASVAELLAFQAKQGGPLQKASSAAPPAPASIAPPPDPIKPGAPVHGFFGPRDPK